MTGQDVYATLADVAVPASAATRLAPTAQVTSVAYDSRRVGPGAAFVALKGLKADGLTFVPQAVANGAALIVSEAAAPEGITTPWLVVRDGRLALALLGAAMYGHPSREMPVVGVTGTNGKTTTTYLLAAIFEAAGRSAGVLGTVHYKVGREEREASRTTPEASDVQALLREMLDRGNDACVMEVSSHALALKRVDGTRFAAGVFTNLTRDHLDFHEDMEAYFAAKRRLFEMLGDAPGVINADDPRAAALLAVCRTTCTYGIQKPADVRPEGLSMDLSGVRFVATTPRGPVSVRSTLVGRPNVYNLLAATATAVAMGLPNDAVSAGLERLAGVPGRFEVVSSPEDGVTVVVDYAHTDDALRNLLETARPLTRGRLVTVFGCGGERDRTKRPLMGMVAARLSDTVVITSDNPRSEDPEAIIDEIKRGIPAGEAAASGRTPNVTAVVDRAEAIARAVGLARPGDIVLIAGKGHEKTQHIGARVIPFDDAEVARGILARRRHSKVAER